MHKDKKTIKKAAKGCLGCFGIFIGILLVVILGLYAYYKWFWEEWPVERIERITGVKVPEFDIIERHESERHFTGDYLDTLIIEFKSMPSDELFDDIDKLIDAGNAKWVKEGNKYTFSTIWGNGYPAPKGEREEEDGIFDITLTKGEKKGEIICGAW